MRVLFVGKSKTQIKYPLIYGFKEIGIETKTCDVMQDMKDEERIDLLNRHIEEFRPDMILSGGGWFMHYNYKEVFNFIKQKGIPHVYWATEDSTFFEWCSIKMIGFCDFIFTTSKICVEKYRDLGVEAEYIPFCCIPSIHKKGELDDNFKHDIVLLSNNYVYENSCEKTIFRDKCIENMIMPLVNEKYDFMIYGLRWNLGRFNINSKYLAPYKGPVQNAYKTAKIVLSIQWNDDGHICFKTFEILGCGGFHIAPYTPLQEEYFKHKKHIVYSKSADDTIKYVDYYLKHATERVEIAKEGQLEAYKNHNCKIRAIEAINILKSYNIIS